MVGRIHPFGIDSKDIQFYPLTDIVWIAWSKYRGENDPTLPVHIYRESNIKFYLFNRKQLNEFWQCCVEDKKAFCDYWSCQSSCQICKWVSAVYVELRDNFFFYFDRSNDKQPILWKVFSSHLDKKLRPCLVDIEIAERK